MTDSSPVFSSSDTNSFSIAANNNTSMCSDNVLYIARGEGRRRKKYENICNRFCKKKKENEGYLANKVHVKRCT